MEGTRGDRCTPRRTIYIKCSTQNRSNQAILTQPQVVGVFSLDKERNYLEGFSGLKFYKRKPLNIGETYDLNATSHLILDSWDSTIQKFQHFSELSHLMKWIHLHKEEFCRKKPSFVLYRGVLTKLLTACYIFDEGWTIAAIYKKGTIYIRLVLTEEWVENKKKQFADPWQHKCSLWGRVFERHVLRDESYLQPNPMAEDGSECNFVFRCTLGKHSLLYGAEMDGVIIDESRGVDTLKTAPDSINAINSYNFVELKTSATFNRYFPNYIVRNKKFLNWWCQCVMARISLVSVGLRDRNGIVGSIEEFNLFDFCGAAEKWNPSVCLNFMDDLLNEISHLINGDENRVVTLKSSPPQPSFPNRQQIPFEVTIEDSSSPNYLGNLL